MANTRRNANLDN
jgi:hypothetical protein